jgi:hypothetical protein
VKDAGATRTAVSSNGSNAMIVYHLDDTPSREIGTNDPAAKILPDAGSRMQKVAEYRT